MNIYGIMLWFFTRKTRAKNLKLVAHLFLNQVDISVAVTLFYKKITDKNHHAVTKLAPHLVRTRHIY